MTELSTEAWIGRLQRWAEQEPNVRLALLVGSQARTERPADAYSDIDLALFAQEPYRLLRDENWISGLGAYWTSHLESNALESGEERRVLFADGQDVDFAVFSTESLRALTTDPRAATVLRRGFRLLVNKDAATLGTTPVAVPLSAPSQDEFWNLVNDYWFHLVWTAKKLRRGERMTALEATNGYLRALLVKMIRWHAICCGPSGQDLWHASRFFEKWADPRVLREFPGTVAQYDAMSIVRALRASRELFDWLVGEIGPGLAIAPPLPDHKALSSFLDELLDRVSS